jgi:hypothetical protein
LVSRWKRAAFARSLLLVREGPNELLVAPRLPVRASIYIAPDGTVHFGALFEELVPVADALGSHSRGRAMEPSDDTATTTTDSSVDR